MPDSNTQSKNGIFICTLADIAGIYTIINYFFTFKNFFNQIIMKKTIHLIVLISLVLLLTNCEKNITEDDPADVESFYFEALVDGTESKAEEMGMSSYSTDIRWITAHSGTGCFQAGDGIGIKIHKNYLKVGEYTLNSSLKDKYSGEYYTRDSSGEVNSVFSTANTNTDGIFTIDMIEESPDTEAINIISGRFAFYAVDENSDTGKVITYGKYKIPAHSAFF